VKLTKLERRPRRCGTKCDLLALAAPLGRFRHFGAYLKSEGTRESDGRGSGTFHEGNFEWLSRTWNGGREVEYSVVDL